MNQQQKKPISRKFLGELFPNRKDANFEKAHLKAYLRGRSTFNYGYTYDGWNQRIPVTHKVKQQLIY